MSNKPAIRNTLDALFFAGTSNKDESTRLTKYRQWLIRAGYQWTNASLPEYVSWLKKAKSKKTGKPLSDASIQAYVSTIRKRYHDALRDNEVRDALYQQTDQTMSIADRKAVVDEILTRIENNARVEVEITRVMHKTDSDTGVWLNFYQLQDFTAYYGFETLHNRRSTAIMTLLGVTGIRVEELCNLRVEDLYQTRAEHPCLVVRRGKGNKQRVVLYHSLFEEMMVDVWSYLKEVAQKPTDYAFTGFTSRHMTKLSRAKMKTRTVQYLFERATDFPIAVMPHDLRRTYARLLYQHGESLEYIRHQLGHEDRKTTEGYIGMIDDPRFDSSS